MTGGSDSTNRYFLSLYPNKKIRIDKIYRSEDQIMKERERYRGEKKREKDINLLKFQ